MLSTKPRRTGLRFTSYPVEGTIASQRSRIARYDFAVDPAVPQERLRVRQGFNSGSLKHASILRRGRIFRKISPVKSDEVISSLPPVSIHPVSCFSMSPPFILGRKGYRIRMISRPNSSALKTDRVRGDIDRSIPHLMLVPRPRTLSTIHEIIENKLPEK